VPFEELAREFGEAPIVVHHQHAHDANPTVARMKRR
jgi:hypothetical protein